MLYAIYDFLCLFTVCEPTCVLFASTKRTQNFDQTVTGLSSPPFAFGTYSLPSYLILNIYQAIEAKLVLAELDAGFGAASPSYPYTQYTPYTPYTPFSLYYSYHFNERSEFDAGLGAASPLYPYTPYSPYTPVIP